MRRYVGFFPSLRTLLPAGAAAVVMALVVDALSSLPWPVRVLIGAVLYCAMVWAISPSARQLVDRLRS
jgi:ABC-type transport system involved in cytochrome bd biosynthesis fused ATPase/permease subunit